MIAAALLAAVLAQGYYTPAEAQALFSQANDAYYKEDYPAAEQGYQKLLDHGLGGPDVLFNMGTLHLAQGHLGQAVLFLERARKSGRAPDVEGNLALARAKQLDQVVGAAAEEPFLQRVAAATSEPLVSWTFLCAWVAGFGLLLIFRFLSPGKRAWAAVTGSLAIALAAFAGALVASHWYVDQTVKEGVVLAPQLRAREFPKDSGKVSFEVHAGLKVRVLEASDKFVRIRLPNGLEGWTEREGVADL
ncbi:MAG: SH3 domain-containing protein [Myxococcaceae bacterium]